MMVMNRSKKTIAAKAAAIARKRVKGDTFQRAEKLRSDLNTASLVARNA